MSRLRVSFVVGLILMSCCSAAADDAAPPIGVAILEAARTTVLLDRVTRLEAENKALADDLAKTKAALKKSQDDVKELAELVPATDKLQANLKAALDELDAVRKRNKDLADEQLQLNVVVENARAAQRAAEADAKNGRVRLDVAQTRIDALTARVSELESAARDPKKVPPLPADVRGKVVRVKGDAIELDVGLDAGLAPGQVLDVFRLTDGGKYLGIIEVTEVTPKLATGRFKSAARKPLGKLKPEEFPQAGDQVGKPGR